MIKIIQKNFAFLLLLQIAALPIFGQSILDLEDQRFAAQINRNLTVLDQLISEDLICIHSNALVETKADFIGSVESGKIVYALMEAETGRTINYLHKKVALVNGVLHVAGTYEEFEFDIRLRYTAVYQKEKRNWYLMHWQSTKLEE